MPLVGAMVGEFAMAYVVPRPERDQDILFIDRLKHGLLLTDWTSVCHFWAGYTMRSKALAERALAGGEADTLGHGERIRKNITFCEAASVTPLPSIGPLRAASARLRANGLYRSGLILADSALALVRRSEASGDETVCEIEYDLCAQAVPGGTVGTPFSIALLEHTPGV
jgi:hypothetical protein